jgi:aminopeptidase-like protein
VNSTALQSLLERLFPINRSLTGDGNRETLRILQETIRDLKIIEVPSGTQAFDWIVPQEWRVKSAYVETLSGEKVIDFNSNNLHLVGYSKSFSGVITKDELLSHLHSIPELPNCIPYVTSYYHDYWGFCVAQQEIAKLDQEYYRVVVDTDHFDGSLTYGEIYLEGDSTQEIIFSTYICHPSMANNELSGPILAAALAKNLKERHARKFSYRFLFLPETIGAIYYLSRNINLMKERTVAIYVLTCLGDNRNWSMINSQSGQTISDKLAEFALRDSGKKFVKYPFTERGSDERQFGSPLINLPVATIMRSKFGTFPEYHTSMDNLDFVNGENLAESLTLLDYLVEIHEENDVYVNVVSAEPWLVKRGLARKNKENRFQESNEKLLMDFLAYADGNNSLVDIAQILKVNFREVSAVAQQLLQLELIKSKKSKI